MWRREIDEVENEYTSHNFSLFAIFLPKLSKSVKIWRSSDKNNFAQFFRHGKHVNAGTLIMYLPSVSDADKRY